MRKCLKTRETSSEYLEISPKISLLNDLSLDRDFLSRQSLVLQVSCRFLVLGSQSGHDLAALYQYDRMNRVNPPFFQNYIWNGMSGLGEMGAFRGLDRNLASFSIESSGISVLAFLRSH
jgi:hypothetical protein